VTGLKVLRAVVLGVLVPGAVVMRVLDVPVLAARGCRFARGRSSRAKC